MATGARRPFVGTLEAAWADPRGTAGSGSGSGTVSGARGSVYSQGTTAGRETGKPFQLASSEGPTAAPFQELRAVAQAMHSPGAASGRHAGHLRPPELCAVHSTPLDVPFRAPRTKAARKQKVQDGQAARAVGPVGKTSGSALMQADSVPVATATVSPQVGAAQAQQPVLGVATAGLPPVEGQAAERDQPVDGAAAGGED